jgi:hypothetical protein
MVVRSDAEGYGSSEKKEVLADIGRREKLATRYEDKISVNRRNLDFARGSYVHIARLYDQIGEHEKADAARKAAASLGKGLRDYLPKKDIVYDLDTELSGVASAFAIAFGALFMAPQLTGNVIGSSGVEMSFIGSLIFLCGLIGLYGFAKRKK